MLSTLAPFLAGAATLYLIQDVTESKHKRPRFNVLATRNQAGLSRETNEIIDLITVDPETFPVGSFRYKAHRYPGDIDIFEKVRGCCTQDTAKKNIAKELQKVALRLVNARKKGVFLGDFKAGIDSRYKIDIGEIDKNKVVKYNGPVVRSEIKNLYEEKLLTNSEYKKLLELAPNQKIQPDEWEELNNELRKHYIVRWDLEEMLRGEKILPGNKILKLEDAITDDSIVKLDIWAPLKGKYNEITNFFLLILQNPDGTETVLNAQLGDRVKLLEKDIQKYASPSHRNSLKLAKRLWNKALTENDVELYDKLYPLFDSDATMLSQIGSEIEVITNMLNGLSRDEIPIKTLIKQIDGFKERITNTLEIQFNTKPLIKIINDIIDYYENNKDNWDPIVINHYLEDLDKKIRKPVEDYSRKFLQNIGIDL